MYQTNPPSSPKEVLPTMYDLPSEELEEPGLPDEYHLLQPQLLGYTFCPVNYPTEQIFVASDLNLYYDPRYTNWYKRPDWFAVVGVDRLYEQRDLRMSYVVWQEGVNPFVVVELLSPGTEKEDLGQTLRQVNQPPTKWEVYERILRVPYYIVFDRYTDYLRAFQLVGSSYSELELKETRVWINDIQLGLGLWQGIYQGIERKWLRWYDAAGNWVLIPEERERQKAQQKSKLIEREKRRVQRLAEQLRALGVEPDLDDDE
ncbi:MAG: Uma2 family endonuclease [Symploca sp. SIO3C6]|nr:Uma2 family endonuclease [Symploca sp. SIO3C6]